MNKEKCNIRKCKNFDQDALTPCEKCKQEVYDMVAEVWAEKLKREYREKHERHHGHERREE